MIYTLSQFQNFIPKRPTFALFGYPIAHSVSPQQMCIRDSSKAYQEYEKRAASHGENNYVKFADEIMSLFTKF